MIRWAILTLSVALIFANGYAYAETFEDHIKFPIPDNVTQQAKMCSIEKITEKEFIFDCKWRFTADGVEQWYKENLKKYGLIQTICEFGVDELTGDCLDEIILDNDKIMVDTDGDGIIDSVFIPEKKSVVEIRYDQALVDCKDNPPDTSKGIEFCALLENIDKCYRGIGYAKGITTGQYIVSLTFILDSLLEPEGINRDDLHAQLKKASLECTYQRTILEPILFGVEALHKGAYFGVQQKYHSEVIVYDKEFWATIPTHATNSLKLTDRDFETENLTAWEKMCLSDKVNNSFKKQQGCVVSYDVGLNLDGTCRDYTVYNHDKTRCKIVPTATRTSGGIDYSNYVTDMLDRYYEIGDSEQLEKIQNNIQRGQELHRKLVEDTRDER